MTKQKTALFLNSGGDYRITDHKGEIVSVEEAKRRFTTEGVDDWNIAFHRLANAGFDLEAVKKYYAAQHEQWLERQKAGMA